MNIKQIAKEAGVSVATVSRVLNHPDDVAIGTREKIQKVMDENGYEPNWFARGLNFNVTKTLGLVLPHTLNTYYMEIANGVEEVARQKQYITFICNTEKTAYKEKEYIDQLISRKVDGIILVHSLGLDEEYIKFIEKQNIPVVCIGKSKTKVNWSSVTVDSRAGAVEMLAHLISNGKRNVALLCGEDPEPENMDIVQGYKNVLRANGIEIDENYILDVENSVAGGYIGMRRIMSMPKMLPSAVFATSDYIAYGAMDAIKEAGLRIPEDISLGGYGNDRMTTLMDPKITTVEVPYRKMGIYGARMLFDIIDDRLQKGKNKSRTIDEDGTAKYEKRSPMNIELRTKLRIRKSSGSTERIGEMF